MPADDCGCPSDRGHAHPRIFTPPLRALTPETTDGFRVIAFAKNLGLRLFPWQRFFLLHALEKLPDGSPRFSTILLLVARQNGKTTIASLLILFWLLFKERQLVVGTAQSLALAEETWNGVVEIIQGDDLLASQMAGEPRMANGSKSLRLISGAQYMPKAATGGATRGQSIWNLFFDELREQKDFKAWGAISKATMAIPDAQSLLASNAGDAESVVLSHFRTLAIEAIDSHDSATRVGLFEYSADEALPPGSLEAARQANPSLGYMITREAILSAFESDPLSVFKTEVLCQWVESMDAPIDLEAWDAAADPAFTLAAAARQLHCAVDMAPDGNSIILAAGFRATADSPVLAQPLKSWAGKDALTRFSAEFPALYRTLRPRSLSWVPKGPSAPLQAVMSSLPSARIRELTAADVPAVCAQFAGWVAAGNIIQHNGDPVIRAQAKGAQRAFIGDGWRFERRIRDDGGHVNGLYAMAMVVVAAYSTPARKYIPVKEA